MWHQETLGRLLLGQNDFRNTTLTRILTRMYEELFKALMPALDSIHLFVVESVVTPRFFRPFRRNWDESVREIVGMDKQAKKVAARLIQGAKHGPDVFHDLLPFSDDDQPRGISRELAGPLVSIGDIQDFADYIPAERLPATTRAVPEMPLDFLVTAGETVTVWEQRPEELEEIQQELARPLNGNRKVKASGQSTPVINLADTMQGVPDHIRYNAKIHRIEESASTVPEETSKNEPATVDNAPPEQADVQESKPSTREEELIAEVAELKKENTDLREEVKELRGIVQEFFAKHLDVKVSSS